MILTMQVLELVICGILKLKVVFFVQIRVLLPVLSICSWKLISYDMHVLLLQVFGFGVHLLRWMLMAPKYLSFILTLKDLRVLGNPMYMTIGLCLDVGCVPFSDLLLL
jgi:hypothetical protein